MDKQRQWIMIGVGIVLLLSAYVLYVGSNHGGRYGAPCFCKACEDKIIGAATEGDVLAQRKLAAAMDGGNYKTDSFNFGPAGLLIGLALMMFIGGMVGSFGQKYTAPVSSFMENRLRGR